jgi:hypothetical protein
MAITQGVNDYLKVALWNLGLPAGHVYKIALLGAAAVAGPSTNGYGAVTGEIANGNGYTTGGKVLTGRVVTAPVANGPALLDFDDPVWPASTITAYGAVIYDDTDAGKMIVAVLDFGGPVSDTNGSFTVDLPASGAGTSFLRVG